MSDVVESDQQARTTMTTQRQKQHRRLGTTGSRNGVALLKRRSDWVYLLPMVIALGFTSIYPVVYSLYNSLFRWNWGTARAFVGFENYRELLTSSLFWNSLGRTVYFAVGAVVIEVTIGLGLASILSQLGKRFRGIVRTILLMPLMVSGIVVSLVWKIMLDPSFGIIPHFLGAASPTSAYLGDEAWALPLIIGIDTWWQTAFVFIILAAALDALPKEPLEAAAVDGATALQRFRYVTLPSLRPWLITIVVIRFVDTLKVFDIIFGTTGGGPGRSTEAIQVITYRTGFKELRMSDAMTLMVLFLILVLMFAAIGALVFRRISRDRHQG